MFSVMYMLRPKIVVILEKVRYEVRLNKAVEQER